MIGSKYFDTSSPSITFSNEQGPEIPHNLAKELLAPPVTIYMEGEPIKGDFSRFGTIKAVSTVTTFNPVTGDFVLLSYDVIDYINCKKLNDPYYEKLLSRIDDKNRFKDSLECPDFRGKYNLSEVFVNHKNFRYHFLSIEILPCSRKDPSQCLPLASVNKLKVVAANAKKTIVPSNYTHPFQINVKMDEIAIDPYQVKYFQFEAKVTKIVDLRNDFVGEEDRAQFVSTHFFMQDTFPRTTARTICPNATGPALTRNCIEYIAIAYRGGSEVVRVKRLYKSPTQIIGEIGGVLKVALMFVMVYAFYLKSRKRSFVIESVYSRKKENRINDKMARILNKGKMEVTKKGVFGHTERVKVAPRSRSRSTNDPKNSKKVQEECYTSATCFSKLQKNFNIFDLFERLSLNKHSRKMLPQAMLIRTMIMKDPALKKYYNGYRKKFMDRLKEEDEKHRLAEESHQNEEGNHPNPEKIENQQNAAPVLPINRGIENSDKDGQIKEGLKLFIERQLRMGSNHPNNLSKGKTEGKSQPNPKAEEPWKFPVTANPPAEIVSKIAIAKNFVAKEVNQAKSGLGVKLASDKGQKESQGSQDGSPLKKSPFRKNSEAFELSALGRRRRVASVHLGRKKSRAGKKFASGRKLLVKSKFGVSRRRRLVKDDSRKEK